MAGLDPAIQLILILSVSKGEPNEQKVQWTFCSANATTFCRKRRM